MKYLTLLAVLSAAAISTTCFPAQAQCVRQPGLLGLLGPQAGCMGPSSQDVQRYYYEQQQAREQAEQQRAANEAQRQVNERQASIDRTAVIARARRAEAERAVAKQAATEAAKRKADEQAAAESSPDNICMSPTVARMVMEEFNGFDMSKRLDIKAVDMEHVTTVSAIPEKKTFVCHTTMQLTSGRKLTGVFSMRPNVAGDMISEWKRD